MDLDTLWSQSPTFRSIMIGKHGLFDDESFSLDGVREMWEERFPEIEWSLCGVDGCTEIVQDGERCTDHSDLDDGLPTWKWYRGILYRLMVNRSHHDKLTEYQDYAKHVGWRRFGTVAEGYRPVHADGNPLNFRPENIFMLSPAAKAALDAEAVDLPTAIRLDDLASDVVAPKGGRRPVVGMFGYTEIAKAAGVRASVVRQAVRRKTLDPQDLKSVVKFVKAREVGQ